MAWNTIVKPGTQLFLAVIFIELTATFARGQPSQPPIEKDRPDLGEAAAPVEAVAFSPDGKVLASGGRDGKIRIWDPDTGKCTATLAGRAEVFSLIYSPDGTTLFSACEDKIKLWDVATGKHTGSFIGHKGVVVSMAISPDGETLVSVSGPDKSRIRFWDVATGENTATLKRTNRVKSVAFSPGGNTLASAGQNYSNRNRFGIIELWDVRAMAVVGTLNGRINTTVQSVVFSPDGKTIASGSSGPAGGSHVRLWDVGTARNTLTFSDESNHICSVAFSPNGKTLATGSSYRPRLYTTKKHTIFRTVRLWDVASGKNIAALSGHDRDVNFVAFSPNGNALATAGWDGTVKLWDVASGKTTATLGQKNERPRR